MMMNAAAIPFTGFRLIMPSGHTEFLTADDLKTLSQTLAPHIAPDSTPRVRAILRAVCEAFNIDQSQLMLRRRPEWIVMPRMAAMHLMNLHTDMTQQRIARHFGLTDHGVVSNAVRRKDELEKMKPKHSRAWVKAERLAEQYLKEVES